MCRLNLDELKINVDALKLSNMVAPRGRGQRRKVGSGGRGRESERVGRRERGEERASE